MVWNIINCVSIRSHAFENSNCADVSDHCKKLLLTAIRSTFEFKLCKCFCMWKILLADG